MSTQSFKKLFCLAAAAACSIIMIGCSSDADSAGATGAMDSIQANTNSFISIDEFCKARVVHVTAHANKLDPVSGSCYIEDNSSSPVVSMIIKRALNLKNLQFATDKNRADYVLNVSFSQQRSGRRTYTTLKTVLIENKNENSVIWTGVASVSGRGNYPVAMYAASMTGALMFNFQQFTSTNVGRRTLQSYYHRLSAAGE